MGLERTFHLACLDVIPVETFKPSIAHDVLLFCGAKAKSALGVTVEQPLDKLEGPKVSTRVSLFTAKLTMPQSLPIALVIEIFILTIS